MGRHLLTPLFANVYQKGGGELGHLTPSILQNPAKELLQLSPFAKVRFKLALVCEEIICLQTLPIFFSSS